MSLLLVEDGVFQKDVVLVEKKYGRRRKKDRIRLMQ